MANTLLTPTVIAREALFQLRNHVVMGGCVHRDYKHEFVKVGDTVTIRKPVKFTVTDGATRSNQGVTENSTTIVINKRKHVSWAFTTQNLTLTIEEYSKRYIEPACISLANQVDVDGTGLYSSLWTSSGTPGTTPATFQVLGNMAKALDKVPTPDDGNRCMVLDPDARWALADALKGIYDASMPKDFIRKGLLGTLANFMIYGDQNVAQHTTGAFTTSATPLVDAAPSEGATTLDTDGWNSSSSTVKEGDVFTIATVNSVNDVSKVSTGVLQQFVVTADQTSSGGDMDGLAVQPEIRSTGAYQTVDSLPADGDAMTFLGSESTAYPQNLAFHRNALALVMVPLELPDSAGWKARTHFDGVSVRLIKDYDIDNDEEIIRLDILYGWKAIYAEIGGRLWG